MPPPPTMLMPPTVHCKVLNKSHRHPQCFIARGGAVADQPGKRRQIKLSKNQQSTSKSTCRSKQCYWQQPVTLQVTGKQPVARSIAAT